jgi:hypothetical protein
MSAKPKVLTQFIEAHPTGGVGEPGSDAAKAAVARARELLASYSRQYRNKDGSPKNPKGKRRGSTDAVSGSNPAAGRESTPGEEQ